VRLILDSAGPGAWSLGSIIPVLIHSSHQHSLRAVSIANNRAYYCRVSTVPDRCSYRFGNSFCVKLKSARFGVSPGHREKPRAKAKIRRIHRNTCRTSYLQVGSNLPLEKQDGDGLIKGIDLVSLTNNRCQTRAEGLESASVRSELTRPSWFVAHSDSPDMDVEGMHIVTRKQELLDTVDVEARW